MPKTTCPSCQAALVIPADLALASVTCPRCLASVRNPAMEGAAEGLKKCPGCGGQVTAAAPKCPYCRHLFGGPAAAAGPAADGPGAPAAEAWCPWCAEPVPKGAVYCPLCGERLIAGEWPVGRGPGGPRSSFHGDVQKDTRFLGTSLKVFSVLGFLGLVPVVLSLGGGAPRTYGAILVLTFLVVGFGSFWLSRQPADQAARGLGRFVVGSFALAGILFVAFIAVGGAGLVFLFAVCALGGGMNL